jgi:hypothetical protein
MMNDDVYSHYVQHQKVFVFTKDAEFEEGKNEAFAP